MIRPARGFEQAARDWAGIDLRLQGAMPRLLIYQHESDFTHGSPPTFTFDDASVLNTVRLYLSDWSLGICGRAA
jgi:hypothetical protein